MHELGVVFHLLDTTKKVAKKNKVKHVNRVTVELGEVSTVIPHLLNEAWVWAIDKEDDLMQGCELKIEGVKAITKCDKCGEEYPTTVYKKVCPYCNSENTHLLTGDQFVISNIEVDT